ncbi:MAG TPA: heavy metal-binding domain-containing protein [Pyrinomonadaceae bacterium]|nr:heavy metal-binding domain-containing protein [Pyrinomonadaceae bacterium]
MSPRILIAPLLAFSLLPSASSMYAVPVVHAHQQGQETEPDKPAEFQYVCPMHDDVTSKKPGKCRKCKMTLEKRKIKQPATKPPDQ